MLDRLIRAFLVVGGVSVACAWTWPGAFPEADPVAVLVRYHTPNVYRAVVAWYYVAPGVAALLAGQFLISTSRLWFARMGVRVGRRFRLRPTGGGGVGAGIVGKGQSGRACAEPASRPTASRRGGGAERGAWTPVSTRAWC